MPTYRELLERTRAEIQEIDTSGAAALGDAPVFVDVRDREEWDEGHIPGAVHLPRSWLESRAATHVPNDGRPVVVYCASGSRSVFATRTLEQLGYEDVRNLAGGFVDWKRNGFPVQLPRSLDADKRSRYSRHLLIPEVGEEGQLRLLDSKVLVIGAGGLGSPASLYLAAAGVGRIGIVDGDVVDASNLQRQVVHSTQTLGEPKVDSAKATIEALNPDVEVVTYRERITSENVERILAEGWDVIVDGADNFPTRYLINDASVWHGIPVVHGSIYRFDGQVTVFKPRGAARGAAIQGDDAVRRHPSGPTARADDGNGADEGGPCYRCLFAQPPPPEMAPSCAEGGVLGVLPGVIGSLQANEALKLALGIGEPLVGRLMLFDALDASFTEVSVRRDAACPVCGDDPSITEYIDYVEFCAAPARAVAQ